MDTEKIILATHDAWNHNHFFFPFGTFGFVELVAENTFLFTETPGAMDFHEKVTKSFWLNHGHHTKYLY